MSRRSFARKSGYRSAKLIIIAAEGEKTEKFYFDQLAYEKNYYSPKVHIEVLKREPSKSDPREIIESLNKFKNTYALRKNFDELWVVCDVDRWGQKKLSYVDQLCRQKGYQLAVSNPCFELWLLLHLQKIIELKHNEQAKLFRCDEVKSRIRKELGSYNKTKIDFSDYRDGLDLAITQAKHLSKKNENWPQFIGSTVYKILLSIKEVISQ